MPQIQVDDVRAAMAPIAARFHGDPTAALAVAGVTGTNGKTTSCFLMRELLEAGGIGAALLGTVKSVIGGAEATLERTTPGGDRAAGRVRAMRAAGDQACAMEVSSHALELHRVDAIHWAAALFTNLTQDHLDFHPTMEDYFLAKRRLFWRPATRARVVNVDDPYGRRLARDFPDAVTFAIDARRASCARPTSALDADRLHLPPGRASRCTPPLPGRFNVSNVLGALAVTRALGVDDGTIAAALTEAGPRAGTVRAGRRGAGLRRARRLRPHARLARQRAARPRASRRRPASSSSSAAAATATAPSAR